MSDVIGRDLFGEPVRAADMTKKKTLISKALARFNYRKSDPVAARVAGSPVCCKTCGNHLKRGDFYKCRLVGCSASTATDIRATWVCDAWRPITAGGNRWGYLRRSTR